MANIMSNDKLSKFISLEIVMSLAVTSFLVGVSYAVLANDQKHQSEGLETVKVQQNKIKKSISAIEKDTAVIRNEQEHIKRDVESILKLLSK